MFRDVLTAAHRAAFGKEFTLSHWIVEPPVVSRHLSKQNDRRAQLRPQRCIVPVVLRNGSLQLPLRNAPGNGTFHLDGSNQEAEL